MVVVLKYHDSIYNPPPPPFYQLAYRKCRPVLWDSTVLYMWLCLLRVEGRGSAVITDVIYSGETTYSSGEEKPSSQTKEKYESLKVIR